MQKPESFQPAEASQVPSTALFYLLACELLVKSLTQVFHGKLASDCPGVLRGSHINATHAQRLSCQHNIVAL